MIITIKTTGKMIAMVGLVFIVLTSTLSWAGDIVFTDYPVRALKVLEINIDFQTALLEAPDGDTTTLTVGDIVGQEEATIVEIQEIRIILEQPPDDSGNIRSIYISLVPVRSAVPILLQ